MPDVIKMTPEYKKKMLGLMPMAETSTHKFIPRSVLARGLTAEEEEFAPRFIVKQWTNEQVIRVKQRFQDEQIKSQTKRKKITVEDVKAVFIEHIDDALVGWENVFDLSDIENPIEIEYGADKINLLPEPILSDIVDELTDLCGIFVKTELQLKKMLEKAKEEEKDDEGAES